MMISLIFMRPFMYRVFHGPLDYWWWRQEPYVPVEQPHCQSDLSDLDSAPEIRHVCPVVTTWRRNCAESGPPDLLQCQPPGLIGQGFAATGCTRKVTGATTLMAMRPGVVSETTARTLHPRGVETDAAAWG